MKRGALLEVDSFSACPDRCVFCSSAPTRRTSRHKAPSNEEIVRLLAEKKRAGFARVNFSGGEPTVHRSFLVALRVAKKLGYETSVLTNGSALSRAAFAKRALPLLDVVAVSLHGADAALHDRVAAMSGSFEKIVAAFQNMEAYSGPLVTRLNVVVCRLNVEALDAIIALSGRFKKIESCSLSMVQPIGDGAARYDALAVPYSALIRQIPSLRAAARTHRKRLFFYGVPPCLFGKDEDLCGEFVQGPACKVSWWSGARQEISSRNDPYSQKSHTPRCEGCRHVDACAGLPDAYQRLYGDAEIHAVP